MLCVLLRSIYVISTCLFLPISPCQSSSLRPCTFGKRFLVYVSKRVWKRKSCAVESSLLLVLCLGWCSVSMSQSLGAGSPLVTRSSLVRWTLLSLCTLTMLLCCIGGVPHWGISCSESAARQRKTTHQGGDTYRELPRAGHCTGLGGDREKKTSRRNVMFVSVCLEVNLQSFLKLFHVV